MFCGLIYTLTETGVLLTRLAMQTFKQITTEQAYMKLKHYCAYQDRCHQEVKDKAYGLGLRKRDVEELTSRLIEENLLNESRFATGYARGKFRMKRWGRVKIIRGLKQRRVSDYCIREAIEEIPDQDYNRVLRKLARDKWSKITSPGVNLFTKMAKTRNYLLQKGFESSLVGEVIRDLSGK